MIDPSNKSRPTLNPKLKDFWMTQSKIKVLYGGRSSSKSWDCAGFAIFLSQACKIKVVCARQFQNRIDDSVYSLLKIQIERFGLKDKFNIQKNKITCIKTGSEFLFYGIARNIDEIKGLESIDVLWLEEVQAITKAQWDVIEPTVSRVQGSQIWIVFNPQYVTDFSYQRFIAKPPKRALIRKINYLDNPFITDDMLEAIEEEKSEDYKSYEHKYLGFPKEDNEDSIIKMSWIDAAIDAHVKLGFSEGGDKRLGYDPADTGDANATTFAHGSIVLECKEWQAKEEELLKSCKKVWNDALSKGARITFDSIGLGAGCGSKFKELNSEFNHDFQRVKYEGWNAGGALSDPKKPYDDKKRNIDMFSNAKAQEWWRLADRFKNTYDAINNGTEYPVDQLISISSNVKHLEKLKIELSTPLKDYDNNARVKVESKKDLKKRDVDSPNLAESFVMCFTKSQKGSISAFIR